MSEGGFEKGTEQPDDYGYLGPLRREKKAVERLIRELEGKKTWVGPYDDDTYTWGRLSGCRIIDLALLAALGLAGLLLLEILRHGAAFW